jgi:hypothetical protein
VITLTQLRGLSTLDAVWDENGQGDSRDERGMCVGSVPEAG